MRSALARRPVPRPLGRALGSIGRRCAAVWRRLPGWVRLPVRLGLLAALAVTLVAAVPYGWTQSAAAGHLYAESQLSPAGGPRADVLLVLGSQVAPGGAEPMPFLKGRLDTTASLVRSGYAKVVLVSGDAGGGSGDETAVMTAYLVRAGVDPGRIVADPHGLDTYDSCVRANRVYGLTRALVVTQPYHLARAVALCRHAGIDADGVGARCDGCGLNVVRNGLRDYLACTKVAVDVLRDREPVVVSPPSTAVADAVARS